MKTAQSSFSRPNAFTLLEMTVVILVLLTLIGIGAFSSSKISEWRRGKEASEVLREVYTAQRMYLSDHPTTLLTNISGADLIPYLPSGATAMPTVKSLDGSTLSILVSVSPPIIDSGSGVPYDPSGKTDDSLWDVGE